MATKDPRNCRVDETRAGLGNKRGKCGSAGTRLGDPVVDDSGPRIDYSQVREGGTESAGAGRAVVAALEGVLNLSDLPRLLWWVGTVRPEALGRVEELGCQLGERMAEGDAGFEDALSRLTEALVLANEKREASGDPLGSPPIWAFWNLFTRKGEPESPFSVLLRQEVGYPTDEQAGMSPRTGGTRE